MSNIEVPRAVVVRMFPDYADTVLWFRNPIRYEDSKLSADLVEDLKRWEQSFYEGLNRDYEFKSETLACRFVEDGKILAQRVADELGENFVIELQEDNAAGRYQAKRQALNAEAAVAFDAMALEVQAEDEEVARCIGAVRRGETTGWYAYSPGSGAVFMPRDTPEDLQRGYPEAEA
ncbi:hypothetical protein [Glutamicibacter uratoxydans]|nr:hypothetical protein [Glutamicibacter uratoxydans]